MPAAGVGMRTLLSLSFLLASAVPCAALDAGFDGYADLRLVAPGGETSWLDGGLGKLRYGRGDSDFQFAALFGQGYVRVTPDFTAVLSLRVAPGQSNFFDPLEAYVRYAPLSMAHWAWSVKAGAFFAPFSLENTELGWTSHWTITPSAINSWFGDELRTLGGEGTLAWRSEPGSFTLTAAAFGWNDPAGVMMAERGFTLDDRPTGLFEQLRIPDASVILGGDTPPDSTPIFEEIDHRMGWYAGASWDDAKQWHLELVRYDNEGNPLAHDDEYSAWHTRFWDAGFSDTLGEFTVLSQALMGDATIQPAPGLISTTDFDSAYALLGWERGRWRLAARAEIFHTGTHTTLGASPLSENGTALTAAATWSPLDWLRLTGEVVSLESRRDERALAGLAPRQSETQAQLAAKVYF
jgi:hypothetical protein